jgi:hypothetical protein
MFVQSIIIMYVIYIYIYHVVSSSSSSFIDYAKPNPCECSRAVSSLSFSTAGEGYEAGRSRTLKQVWAAGRAEDSWWLGCITSLRYKKKKKKEEEEEEQQRYHTEKSKPVT